MSGARNTANGVVEPPSEYVGAAGTNDDGITGDYGIGYGNNTHSAVHHVAARVEQRENVHPVCHIDGDELHE